MFTRRDLLRLGLLSTGAALIPRRAARAATLALFDDDVPTSPRTTPFVRPLPIPPTAVPTSIEPDCDVYDVEMREGVADIIPGLPTPIWGYDGITPGPTFRARFGRAFKVRQKNSLGEDTVVHLHGAHTPPDSDGHPTDFVLPGTTKEYFYPNIHPAATHWYHDHTNDFTGPNVYRGLAGMYIVHDDFEDALNLPSGDYDIPLVFQDRRFNADGSLFYNPFDHDGFLGDKFLVNGAIQPYFRVERRKYRFRLLNGSNARYYELSLSNRRPIVQIGSEGGLLPAPLSRTKIRIAMAERIDVVIDFSQYPVGTSFYLQNCLVQQDGRGPDRVVSSGCTPLVRFDVAFDAVDPSSLPNVLRPVVRANLPLGPTRTFEFERSNGAWVINGRFFDENRVDARPRFGTKEVWRLVNKSGGWHHPIHIHHDDFIILDRNGRTPPPEERGYKDTVNLAGNDVVRVEIPFHTFKGRYVFHCHNVEHEDMRMMGQFEVVD